MIDVDPTYLNEVKQILGRCAPECEVWAFGSRVRGRAERNSDLDLVLVAAERLDWRFVERLKDAFSESDLPFTVDVLDWHGIDDEFREIIARDHVILQKVGASGG